MDDQFCWTYLHSLDNTLSLEKVGADRVVLSIADGNTSGQWHRVTLSKQSIADVIRRLIEMLIDKEDTS